MGYKIGSIEYYLPDYVVDNEALSKEFSDWSSKKIEKKVGIRERHVVSENETSLDLAVKAGEKVLQHVNRETIDFLIVCTQTPNYYLPPNSCILQEKLGLQKSVGVFDFNMGCTGYIYGLALARGLIGTGIAEHILFIASETYSKLIHPKDKSNRTIFGDGAAATIIGKDENDGIKEFVFGTDGSGAGCLIVPNGGLMNKYNSNAPEIESSAGSFRTDNNLYMNGPEVFNFTLSAVPKLIDDILAVNGTTLDELDYVIFHQANKYMLDYLRTKIGIPPEKFYVNLLHTGNTVSATIPIALKDCLDNNIIASGDKILLAGFGVGLSWAGTIVEL